jgi:hypothetical protein
MNTGDPVIGVEVAGQRADQADERSWVTYWHPLRNSAGEIVGVNVAGERTPISYPGGFHSAARADGRGRRQDFLVQQSLARVCGHGFPRLADRSGARPLS